MRSTLSILLLLGVTSMATAQSEETLRRYFEGKSVVVKLEMPGTEDGVDVYPGTSMPVDFHVTRLRHIDALYADLAAIFTTRGTA